MDRGRSFMGGGESGGDEVEVESMGFQLTGDQAGRCRMERNNTPPRDDG